jgi:O-antigen/teichoic acid export membrane protein
VISPKVSQVPPASGDLTDGTDPRPLCAASTVDAKRERSRTFYAAQNVAKVFSLEVVARLVGQLALLMVARMLQPASFGTFLVASTAFSVVLVLVDLGMQDLALQRLSGGNTDNGDYRTFTSARLTASLAGTILALPVLTVLYFTDSSYGATPLLLLGLAPATFISGFNIKYRIRERYFKAALASATFILLLAIGSLGGTALNQSSTGAALGAVVALYAGAILWGLIDREPVLRLGVARARALAMESRPFLFAGLCVALYSRGDRFFVAWLAGKFDAGLYGAAYSLIFAASLLTLAVQAVALPQLVRSWQGRLTWSSDSRKFLLMLLVLGLGLGVVLFVAADPIVGLMYGPGFRGAVPLVRMLSPLVPLYFLNTGLGNCLIACGRQRLLARITGLNLVVGAISFPLLTLALGASGTAVASVLVEVTGLLMLLRVLKGTFELGNPGLGAVGGWPAHNAE